MAAPIGFGPGRAISGHYPISEIIGYRRLTYKLGMPNLYDTGVVHIMYELPGWADKPGMSQISTAR